MSNNGIIYKTTNKINGKIYVGQTIYHADNSKYLGSGKFLKNAIKKYGKENFMRETIEETNVKDINNREIYWIAKLRATDKIVGYNIEPGGQPRHALSEYTKKKISKSEKGKIVSKESVEKMRKSLKKLWSVDSDIGTSMRNNMSELMKGENNPSKRSEVKRKISKSLTGKTFSDERKQHISDSLKGRTLLEKTKKKISERSSGKGNGMYGRSAYSIWIEKYGKEEADKRKIETKKKMSKSRKKYLKRRNGNGEF